jgi:arylamine N-acetyltransferase
MTYSTLFDAPRPAIHMVLQVNLPDGPYIADVGFGNLAPTCALRLELGLEPTMGGPGCQLIVRLR